MLGNRHVYCSVDQTDDALPHLIEHKLGIEIVFDTSEMLWPQIKWEELLARADAVHKAGLSATVHGPFHGINLGSRDPHTREFSQESLIAAIETCVSFGSPLMVLHTGFMPQLAPKSRRKWLANFLTGLQRVLEAASKHKILLALENTYEEDTELFQEIFETVQHPHLCMCLDVGHATCFGKIDPMKWVKTFGDKICHVHLSDNDGSADLHWSLGSGSVDMPKLLAPIHELPQTITITYEVAGADVPQSDAYFIELMSTLKQ